MSDETMMKHDEDQPANVEPRVTRMSPACDVYESADEFLILAEMPGVENKDLDLSLDRSRLSIQGTRTLDDSSAVHYARVFELPDAIDRAKIDAKLVDGVLNVHMPKAQEARVRRIQVTAG